MGLTAYDIVSSIRAQIALFTDDKSLKNQREEDVVIFQHGGRMLAIVGLNRAKCDFQELSVLIMSTPVLNLLHNTLDSEVNFSRSVSKLYNIPHTNYKDVVGETFSSVKASIAFTVDECLIYNLDVINTVELHQVLSELCLNSCTNDV